MSVFVGVSKCLVMTILFIAMSGCILVVPSSVTDILDGLGEPGAGGPTPFTVTGWVQTENGKAASGVTVSRDYDTELTTTAEDGSFRFVISGNSQRIILLARLETNRIFEAEIQVDGPFTGESHSVGTLVLQPTSLFLERVTYAADRQSVAIVAGDFNSDSIVDVGVANVYTDNVSVLMGLGDGTFREPLQLPAGDGPFTIEAVDINGDGLVDLVTANRESKDVSILVSNGDGSFQEELRVVLGAGYSHLLMHDLNGDGRGDLVAANATDPIQMVFLGHGDGSFQDGLTLVLGGRSGKARAGDFNRDGSVDLVVTNYKDDTVSVALGNGDGTFRDGEQIPTEIGPFFPLVGDFNGDLRDDFACINVGSFTVSIFYGNGDGTFQAQPIVPVPDNTIFDSRLNSMYIGDMDRDGVADLVTSSYGERSLTLQIGKEDGSFRVETSYMDAGWGVGSLIAADFNGDERLDLAVANANSIGIAVLLHQ